MNIKYNYLYEYLINDNKDVPFNIDKFNLYSNSVDYLYFFVCNAKKNTYLSEERSSSKKRRSRGRKSEENDEEEQLALELINEDFEEEENDYFIRINRFIPVLVEVNNKYVFRNLDAFYIRGFLKVPIEYFKRNPAINNYSKLVRNITNNAGNFTFIDISTFINEQKIGENYNYIENDYTFNNNILFNTWTGLSNKENNDNYNVEWVKLDIKQITNNVLMYDYTPVITYDTNVKNIDSRIKYDAVINAKNAQGVYANNIAKIAHKYYMPYSYNLNNMNAYNWINFINNQYDYGVFITENNQINFIENWENIKDKYFSTFGYPEIKIQKNIIVKSLQSDPKWKTVENKIEYLKNCKKIGNKYYTKDFYYVCCEHEYNKLHGKYYENMIIKENGQEICKYCGELLGNYNDEKVFAESMSEFDKSTKINYRWNNRVTEKVAKESWNKLSLIVNAIDNKFSLDVNNINKFIQLYHNTYKNIINSHQIPTDSLINQIKQIYLDNSQNKDINSLSIAIANKFIEKIYKDKVFNDEENKNICMNKFINLIRKYIYIYYSASARYNSLAKKLYLEGKIDESERYKKLAKIDPSKIFSFMKLIQKRTNQFINLITIGYIIGKIYCDNQSDKNCNHVINFSDIDWSIIIGESYDENQEKTTIIFTEDDILDLSIFNITDEDKITRDHLINYINKYYEQLGGGVSIKILTEMNFEYINNDKIADQEKILKRHLISDIPHILDLFTCHDIITRDFNSNASSLQELAHMKFPSNEEYINNKYTNNIAKYFDPLKRISQFNYTSLINEINKYITEYEKIIFDAILDDKDYPMPDINKFRNEMSKIEELSNLTKKSIISLASNCNKNNRIRYNKMSDFILVGIDDILQKYELFLNDSEEINNIYFNQTYSLISKVDRHDRAVEIYKQLCKIIITCYLLCTYIEDVNIYNILNICIDNFYMNLIENNIPYTFIKNYPTTNVDTLIDKFITEFFDYNKLENIQLKFLFKELKKHTQLFITPDYYLDGNTKINRIMNKISTEEEREIELKQMDIEENGVERFIDYDKVDFINFGTDVVETLDGNELIGGEIEDDLIIDEDAY